MGQIIIRKQVPKYCNLSAIQQGGSKADIVLDEGEIWLVDTTNNVKLNGTGLYDAYIEGNGNSAAKSLTLKKLGGSGMVYEDSGTSIETATVKRTLSYPVPSSDNDKIPTTQAVGTAIQNARQLITQEINDAVTDVLDQIPDSYTKEQVDTKLSNKQNTISSVTVAVDNNSGTPAASVTFTDNTLAFSFQNLKGPQGEQGVQGPQGIQGERGAEGSAGITGDVSALNIRQTVEANPTTPYTATDVAGAVALQYILTHDIDGGFYV